MAFSTYAAPTSYQVAAPTYNYAAPTYQAASMPTMNYGAGPSYQTSSPIQASASNFATYPATTAYVQAAQPTYAAPAAFAPLSVTEQVDVVEVPVYAASQTNVPDVQIDNYASYQKIGAQLEELLAFERGIREEIDIIKKQVNSTYSELKAIEMKTAGPPPHVTIHRQHQQEMATMQQRHTELLSTIKAQETEDSGPPMPPSNLGYGHNYNRLDAMQTHSTKLQGHTQNAMSTMTQHAKTYSKGKKMGGCC